MIGANFRCLEFRPGDEVPSGLLYEPNPISDAENFSFLHTPPPPLIIAPSKEHHHRTIATLIESISNQDHHNFSQYARFRLDDGQGAS